MRRTLLFSICGGLLFLWSLATPAGDTSLKYPKTKRVEHVDDYHGTKVADPYRWLEADVRESKEVAAWVEAENKVTNAYLEAIPERDAIKKRLTELWNFERFPLPTKKSGMYFFTRNDGLQNQSVLYVADALEAKPRVLLDPNKWSKDGTVSLAGTAVSPEAKFLAYGKSEGGSDWHTWHVLDVRTGKEMSDKLNWIKFSNISWTNDGKGFFYTRYPEPEKGKKFQGLAFNAALYYHRVGTVQGDDVLVYKRPDHPDWGFSAEVSEDGRYLVASIWKGTDHRNPVVYRDLRRAFCRLRRADRQLREQVRFHRQRRSGLLLRHRSRSADGPADRHRHAQAGAQELEGNHSHLEKRPARDQPRRQPVCRQLPQGRPIVHPHFRYGGKLSPRCRAARHRRCRWLWRRAQ